MTLVRNSGCAQDARGKWENAGNIRAGHKSVNDSNCDFKSCKARRSIQLNLKNQLRGNEVGA
jgi:hypothetical protein